MVLSLNEIQGLWSEKNATDVWEVNGIVAEKASRQRGQKKRPIVLNNGPNGVMWGSGNLTGNMEDGVLVWRNRRGEAAYCWEKSAEKIKGMPVAKMTGAAEARMTQQGSSFCDSQVYMPNLDSVLPPPSRKNSIDKLTPRSTASGVSNETAEITAAIGSSAMYASHLEEQPDDLAVAEMKLLMEMARSRLLVGDVYTSMRYITLAQQVQPLVSSFGDCA
jgi:hypothetical protein